MERWPSQLGGAGDPAHIGAELFSRGTVLSPPIFMVVAMMVALLLVAPGRPPWIGRVGFVLALIVAAVGVVGAFAEVGSAATPEVPRGAQTCGLIGVALSAWVVVEVVRAWMR